MSQKVSPILFKSYVYKKSKWFTSQKIKFSLNEDLQLCELLTLICKFKIINQYFFIDKIIYYKYTTKIRIYIYFYCKFTYFKQNIIINKAKLNSNQYLTIFYLYYKYFEMLQIKKLEILKLLRILINKNLIIQIYLKNINPKYKIQKELTTSIKTKTNSSLENTFSNFSHQKQNMNKLINCFWKLTYKNNYNNKFNIYKSNINFLLKQKSKQLFLLSKRYSELKYYKTLHFLLYTLCYPIQNITTISVMSLIKLIFFELHYLDNTLKNYKFLFYTLFNVIREQLKFYLKDDNCILKGIRIQIKGRYFLTKRKRVFIFNLGNLNLNQIQLEKDYYNLNLIKSTGSSSIKIWLTYKKKCH